MSMISVTFDWTDLDSKLEKMTLTIPEATLRERDPKGTSLISAKLSFVRGQPGTHEANELTMSPTGPGEDEYMSPALIQFIWTYLTDAAVEVTPALDPLDCVSALGFFGFDKVVVTVPDTDPRCVGKQLAYKVYREGLAAVTTMVAFIKKTCVLRELLRVRAARAFPCAPPRQLSHHLAFGLATSLLSPQVGGAGVHFIVDDTNPHMNQFGETVDVLLDHYAFSYTSKPALGTAFFRLGTVLFQKDYFRMLSTEGKCAANLRTKIANDVKAFGGLNVEWTKRVVAVVDVGEYGNHDYSRAERWVLKVTLDDADKTPSEEGIKRRKVA